ncbi:MAG: DNA-processing protein DprA [Planctomycetota bacterium]
MDAAEAYLRLALIPGLGPITAHHLLDAVDAPGAVFGLTMAQLRSIDGVGAERARRILDPRLDDALAGERARCHAAGIRVLTLADADYPAVLRQLSDPPLALWIRGQLAPRDRLAVAVVGPRRPSAYGHRQARRLSLGLARVGATIVSGLARGIDTVAHEAALAADGRTIGVLGGGFDRFYPAENAGLADAIAADHGAVISEFPCDARPSPGTFPRRNRIVAALALGTLVIEAGARSGALITARLAGELGREAMVLPGPIDRPEHVGSNRLLRDGATLITSLDDLLEELPPLATLASAADATPSQEEHPRLASLNQRERAIYRLLDDTPRSIDDIHRVAGLPASSISATLLSLELRRLARKMPGGYVAAT